MQRQGNWGVLAAGGARTLINSLSAFVQTLLLGSPDQLFYKSFSFRSTNYIYSILALPTSAAVNEDAPNS